MSNDTSILVDNTVLLTQLRDFITQLPTESYGFNNPLLQSGTIGAHTRHILDHYQAFLLSIEALILSAASASLDAKEKVLPSVTTVNYDHRKRDVRIEQSTEVAASQIRRVVNELQDQITKLYAICKIDPNPTLNMICATNTDEPGQPLVSSLARELVFLHSHTTHHMAIIRMLALASGHQVEADFGKAASTKQFEQEIKKSDNVHVQSQLA